MSEQNIAVVNRYLDEMCNQRMLDVAGEIFSAGHVYHDPSSPWVGPGPQGQKDLLALYHGAFPDARWTIEEMHAAGDTVITRWTGSGTQNGDLPGVPATGNKVSVAGVWMQRFAGGRIVESWNIWDTYGMLRQLGVVPALGGSTAGA